MHIGRLLIGVFLLNFDYTEYAYGLTRLEKSYFKTGKTHGSSRSKIASTAATPPPASTQNVLRKWTLLRKYLTLYIKRYSMLNSMSKLSANQKGVIDGWHTITHDVIHLQIWSAAQCFAELCITNDNPSFFSGVCSPKSTKNVFKPLNPRWTFNKFASELQLRATPHQDNSSERTKWMSSDNNGAHMIRNNIFNNLVAREQFRHDVLSSQKDTLHYKNVSIIWMEEGECEWSKTVM